MVDETSVGLDCKETFYGRLRPSLAYSCLYKFWVLLLGVLMLNALLFGVYVRALEVWQLPRTQG